MSSAFLDQIVNESQQRHKNDAIVSSQVSQLPVALDKLRKPQYASELSQLRDILRKKHQKEICALLLTQINRA